MREAEEYIKENCRLTNTGSYYERKNVNGMTRERWFKLKGDKIEVTTMLHHKGEFRVETDTLRDKADFWTFILV